MTEFRKIAGPEDAGAHAIFFHGLGGSIESTWGKFGDNSCWPAWLSEDVEGLAVWAVGYSAPKSEWLSQPSLPLSDLAHVLLQQIVLEPALGAGNVALIGYSLGGVVAKAVLRAASDARTDAHAGGFFNRVERFATIATPHAGSRWATLQDNLSLLFRPSPIAKSLRAGDHGLRDLNKFFLNWGAGKPGGILAVSEYGRSFYGKVVEPESANPGVVKEVPTDATHSMIVRIANRENVVYRALLRFLQELPKAQLRLPAPSFLTGAATRDRLLGAIDGSVSRAGPRPTLSWDAASFSASLIELGHSEGVISVVGGVDVGRASSAAIVSDEIHRRLDRLRGGRFIPDFPREIEARAFVENLLRGDLAGGADKVRAEALAWAARLLAQPETEAIASEALAASEALQPSELATIASAFIRALTDRQGALALLAPMNTRLARAASLFIVSRQRPPQEALAWFERANLSREELDEEGRLLLLTLYVQDGRWDEAGTLARGEEDEARRTPQLLMLSALTRVTLSLPDELRSLPLQVPIHPRSMPLASDDAALSDRRAAAALFEEFSPIAAELGCARSAALAEDMALWLRLRDPATTVGALEQLHRSTEDQHLVLRQLTLLLDYGIELDLDAVERAIDREEELSGGASQVAATARFALAFTKASPAAAAAYLRDHSDQLFRHLVPGAVAAAEIELLVRAGMLDEAKQRLPTVSEDAGDPLRVRAAALIAEARGEEGPPSPPGDEHPSSYSVAELMSRISSLVAARDWLAVRNSATELLARTRDVNALVVLVRALSQLQAFSELHETLAANPELRDQDDELRMQWAWSLYRAGELSEASSVLEHFDPNEANWLNLTINIALASGRWDSLHALIETVFTQRDSVPAPQLIQTAQLAQTLGSGRTRGLIDAAVSKAPDDPQVLIGAYTVATASGWEEDAQAGLWIERAAALSDESGPIQSVSLEDLIDRQPGWQERQDAVLEALFGGELPMFGAAKLLHRTLTEMLLVAAISNIHEPDPRRRSIIPTRSGRRRVTPERVRRIVLDPSTFLVLLIGGVLEDVVHAMEHIVIPHDTLLWLFHDRQRLPFHQPSRVREARFIRDEIALGHLQTAVPQAALADGLAAEIGLELAALLSEAAAEATEFRPQFVIRSLPILKIGSFTGETANIQGYENVLRSCSDVVRALLLLGAIPETLEKKALDYLGTQEMSPAEPQAIPRGSTLYLDGLSLTFLYHAGVLGHMSAAGFRTFVSTDAIQEQDNLLAHDRRAAEVDRLISDGRAVLEAGLERGRISLGQGFTSSEDKPAPFAHPSLRLFDLAAGHDAVVVDDRALSRFDNVETAEGLVPVISSFELIAAAVAQGAVPEARRLEVLGRLRQANLAFLPVEPEELRARLAQASRQDDGSLVEPLELRTLRQNIQSLSSSKFLLLPSEGPWLLELMASLRQLLREQWVDEADEALAGAKTTWLLSLHDLRPWSHRMPGTFDEDRLATIFVQPLLLAITQFEREQAGSERFSRWIDRHYLPELRRAQPKYFAQLVASASAMIERVRAPTDEEHG